MAEERPLLKELAPRLHDFLVDPWGRLWGGWRYPKPEEEKEGVRLEIEPALRRPLPIVSVGVEVPEVVKPKPEIMPEF